MTENDNQTEQAEPTILETLQGYIVKAKGSAERIKVSSERSMDKALEERELMSEINLELEELTENFEELANTLEGKESELFGSPKEIGEVAQVMDTDPNSPTFQSMIDVPV